MGWVEAGHRRGGADLVEVDGVDAALGHQPVTDLGDLVLPERRSGAHGGQSALRAVLLDVDLAAGLLAGAGDALFGKTGDITVPQAAIDVGHDDLSARGQLARRFGEAGLGGEVLRVAVVERDLVPAVPVQADG